MMAPPSNCECATCEEIPPEYRQTTGETEFVTFEATVCIRCGNMIQSHMAVKEAAVEAADPTELEIGTEMVPKEAD